MLRQIVPVFFTRDIPATLAYYTGKLGFQCLGTWQDPPVYAIVARDRQVIHFRCAAPPTANPDKYADEPVRGRCRRTLWGVRRPRRRVRSRTWQHALALPGVRGEGLRWPSAGFRREPIAFFQGKIRKRRVFPEFPGADDVSISVRPCNRRLLVASEWCGSNRL